ncbi:MAG: hypothetical protein J2P37_29480 [Ktedonobacteraceae bacterium]|nr:hypothetical protein [Ktedonobacteraceae bacterium]
MKKPRIEDFDPAAAERKLGSPLDDMPQIVKPAARESAAVKQMSPSAPRAEQAMRPTESPALPAPDNAISKKSPKSKPHNGRAYERRTFDFYADQIAFLTRRSLEDRLAGGEGSMNAMVREALDNYIKEKSPAK